MNTQLTWQEISSGITTPTSSFPTGLYTDVGRVVAALAFQSPETLNAAASVGTTSITLNQAPPADWQVGAILVLDVNNPSLRETVTITAPPNGNILTVSSLINGHAIGSPVVNGTIAYNYVAPASRWFDSLTYTQGGFSYEQVTETKEGYIDNRGFIIVPLSKTRVNITDVSSVTFQSSPLDPSIALDITKAWVKDDYFLEIVPAQSYYQRSGLATVTYKGGYNPLPDDLVNAVTILVARLYKIRDTGYSDVIGNADLGIMQYRKPIPPDVASIVQRYRRWTE